MWRCRSVWLWHIVSVRLWIGIWPLLAASLVQAGEAKWPAVQATNDVANKGALCVIKADNQLVMIKEVLTGRLSLPGGLIHGEEDPARVAQRETWEETGLVVQAIEPILTTDSAIIYFCQLQHELNAFSQVTEQGFHVLPAWLAPDFGLEVMQVYLLAPQLVDQNEYRLVQQWPLIQQSFAALNNQTAHYQDNFSSAATPWHQVELKLITQLQASLDTLPVLTSQLMYQLLSALSQLCSLSVLLILLPVLWQCIGKAKFLQLTFMLVVISSLIYVLQRSFAQPRPYAYDFNLQTVELLGYSTPSLSAALMLFIAASVFIELRQKFGADVMQPYLPVAVLLVLLQGFASVWLGKQFFTDTLLAWSISGLILWNNQDLKLARQLEFDSVMTHRVLWWGISLLLLLVVALYPSLWLGQLCALSLAIALYQTSYPQQGEIDLPLLSKAKVIVCQWVVIAGIVGLFFHINTWFASSSVYSFLSASGLWFLAGLSLLHMERVFTRTIKV